MFRVKDLLKLPTMSKAKLIAGDKGLEKGIRWSYKAENMNFAAWVHGHELLIVSTPVINSKDFDLHKLIEDAIRLNISGVLLLIGDEYISKIAVKTLALADKNSLPIISLPGTIPLVDIFEELGHAIAYQDKRQSINDDLLAGIVFGNEIDTLAISSRAELLDYSISKPQRVFIARIGFIEDTNTQDLMNFYTKKLENIFSDVGSSAVISRFHRNIIGITGEENECKINEIFALFCDELMKKYNFITCQIGIGSKYEELSMYNQSFSEASAALKIANPIQWYEKLGFLKLLIDAENQKKLSEYVDQILGGIISHDKNNNADLINTLIEYFDCNENMKEVGNKIFIHPNTVKYRLQQIEDISGLKLSISHEKMELYNALLILQCIGKK